MKKILLSFLFLSSIGASAQTTVFEDSFDTYTDFAITGVGSWTLIDVDLKMTYGFSGVTFANSGVAKSFQVFNATTTVAPLTPTATSNWTARTGDKHMVCFAASTAPALNNDWLISPQMALGSSGNVLTFWAKSCDATYGLEKFKVGISAGNATTGVTLLSTGTVITPSTAVWTQYTYTVPTSFNGQSVYFSINCISDDQFGFAVDDFKVTTTGTLNTESFAKNNFTVYPNPATDIINISNLNGLEITKSTITDINGRIVKEINSSVNAINISDLTAGLYFLNVTTTTGNGTTKIVKK
jgi:hypothetical protein